MTGADSGWIKNPRYAERSEPATSRVEAIIGGARDTVVASSFLLADDRVVEALMEASRRGVRCYLLLAAEARLKRETGNEFEAKARERHVRMLEKLADNVLVRSSGEFHAKAVVADPMGEDPRGMIMTANLTTEALERNEELFVDVSGDEAKEASLVLREALWERATHELVGGYLRSCKPLGKVEPVATNRVLQGGSNPQLKDRLIEMLDAGPSRVVASSFGWEASHPVVERLRRLAGDGADVTVLARAGRREPMEALRGLRDAGARVVGFKWLHAKALATESQAIVMSANIESNGLDRGFEMGIALDGRRASEVRSTLGRWADNREFELGRGDGGAAAGGGVAAGGGNGEGARAP